MSWATRMLGERFRRSGFTLVELLTVLGIMGVIGLALANTFVFQVRVMKTSRNFGQLYAELSQRASFVAEYSRHVEPSTANVGTSTLINFITPSSIGGIPWVSFELVPTGNKFILTADTDALTSTDPTPILGNCPYGPTIAPPACPAGPEGKAFTGDTCPTQLLRGQFSYYTEGMMPFDSGGNVNAFDAANTTTVVLEVSLTAAIPVRAVAVGGGGLCDVDCFTSPDACLVRTVKTNAYFEKLNRTTYRFY